MTIVKLNQDIKVQYPVANRKTFVPQHSLHTYVAFNNVLANNEDQFVGFWKANFITAGPKTEASATIAESLCTRSIAWTEAKFQWQKPNISMGNMHWCCWMGLWRQKAFSYISLEWCTEGKETCDCVVKSSLIHCRAHAPVTPKNPRTTQLLMWKHLFGNDQLLFSPQPQRRSTEVNIIKGILDAPVVQNTQMQKVET